MEENENWDNHNYLSTVQLPFGMCSKTVKRAEPQKYMFKELPTENGCALFDESPSKNNLAGYKHLLQNSVDPFPGRLHREDLPHPSKLRKRAKSNIQQKIQKERYLSFQNHLQQLKAKQSKHTEDIQRHTEEMNSLSTCSSDGKGTFLQQEMYSLEKVISEQWKRVNKISACSTESEDTENHYCHYKIAEETESSNTVTSNFISHEKMIGSRNLGYLLSRGAGESGTENTDCDKSKDKENGVVTISNKYGNTSEEDDWFSQRWKPKSILKRYEE